jgi:hypothetical protein
MVECGFLTVRKVDQNGSPTPISAWFDSEADQWSVETNGLHDLRLSSSIFDIQ